jgi:hypothetical protein
MAVSALKFIGLAVGAVALGVLSASFAFSQLGSKVDGLSGVGSNDWTAISFDRQATKDVIPARIRHIIGRY